MQTLNDFYKKYRIDVLYTQFGKKIIFPDSGYILIQKDTISFKPTSDNYTTNYSELFSHSYITKIRSEGKNPKLRISICYQEKSSNYFDFSLKSDQVVNHDEIIFWVTLMFSQLKDYQKKMGVSKKPEIEDIENE